MQPDVLNAPNRELRKFAVESPAIQELQAKA